MSYLQPASDKKGLSPDWFPANFQAVIWRNWDIVPIKNIAAALNCTEDRVKQSASELGLNPDVIPNPLWMSRGYLTIIRNNWHIASYGQILKLLSIDEKELAFILKEDDFMWTKMGNFKPSTIDNMHRELTESEKCETEKIRENVLIYRQLTDFSDSSDNFDNFGNSNNSDNSFDFLKEFYNKSGENDDINNINDNIVLNKSVFRIAYSYFAVYGDPLLNEKLDPYPDELLKRYAQTGVNGVWLQGILYQLADFKFDPNMSKDREKRISNLKKLIKRAAKYNIGVYLYMNEPRAMPAEFFEKYPHFNHLKGEQEYDAFAMCTSQPEVRDYLYNGMKQLFTEAKGLAGFIAITMSENLTNCYSRTAPANIKCERCKERKPAEVVAEVNNILAKGAHDADPSAKAISWTWAWGNDWTKEAIDMLCENQIIQCTSEESLITRVGGVAGSVLDYTISQPGPGEKSKAVWQYAAERGFELSAKVQINNTWELSNIPYIPALDLIETHIKNLIKQKITNLQLCWTLGGYPSINMQLVDYLMQNPENSAKDFLIHIFGCEFGAKVYEAQKIFGRAFAEFPYHIGTAYAAPQNFGVSAPFYMQNTGYTATMIGFPYDDINSWRSIYPVEIYTNQMLKVAEGMGESLEKLREVKNTAKPENENELLDDMILNVEAAACKMRSVCNHIQFVTARNATNRNGMIEAIKKEKENVMRMIELRKKDSRIGFEASNHYFYSIQDLLEKLLNLDWCINKLI